jgi:hypothetical protein
MFLFLFKNVYKPTVTHGVNRPMEPVFFHVCHVLVPWIMSNGFVMGPDWVSTVDGSVTRTVTAVNCDDELEIVMGKGNANRVTVRWSENEIIIDRGSTEGFFLRFNVGLRETAEFQTLATLDDVFACVMSELLLV